MKPDRIDHLIRLDKTIEKQVLEIERLTTEGALKDAVIEAARTTVHEDDSYYNVTHELEDALIAFDAVSSRQKP